MKMEGIESIKAGDGKDALEILEKETVDMVLMDLEMPIIDGLEATRRMKKIEKLANIPVVAVTANALPQKLKECEDIGMAGWVTKPVFREKLFEVMMKAKNN